jgi:hypothetical protein
VAVSPDSKYGRYVATVSGEQDVLPIWRSLNIAEQKFLKDVRAFVTGRSFNRLLRDVYSAFPDFATKSLFRG